MSLDIRLPNITATDTDGKMAQMQSYMHQLVEQLNWALSTVDNAIQGNTSNVVMTSQSASNSEEDAVDTFNSIKALIIKSADIVKAYEESMKTEYNGEYIAVSDFGTYLEKTNVTIEENSHSISEAFTKVETITREDGEGRLDKLEDDVRETNGYIKRGELYEDEYGNTVYGVEIGQTGDDKLFSYYARFTSKRLSFFDKYGNEVAYIGSDPSRLYINDAIFLRTVVFGNYKADTSDGLAFTWIGG